MPQFSYKARRRSGELVEGVLEVADRPAALMQIQRLGLFPIAVDTAKGGAAATGQQRDGKKVDLLAFLPPAVRAQLQKKRKPKMQELATFTQQLANLLNSGMPLTVALNSMTHLESRGIPSEVSRDLKQEVSEGRGLSDAMARQPRIFFGFVCQHGARRRAKRFARGSFAAHGEPFPAVCRGAGKVHLGADLSGDGVLRGRVHHHLFHVLHDAALRGNLQRVQRSTAAADSRADRGSAIWCCISGGCLRF